MRSCMPGMLLPLRPIWTQISLSNGYLEIDGGKVYVADLAHFGTGATFDHDSGELHAGTHASSSGGLQVDAQASIDIEGGTIYVYEDIKVTAKSGSETRDWTGGTIQMDIYGSTSPTGAVTIDVEDTVDNFNIDKDSTGNPVTLLDNDLSIAGLFKVMSGKLTVTDASAARTLTLNGDPSTHTIASGAELKIISTSNGVATLKLGTDDTLEVSGTLTTQGNDTGSSFSVPAAVTSTSSSNGGYSIVIKDGGTSSIQYTGFSYGGTPLLKWEDGAYSTVFKANRLARKSSATTGTTLDFTEVTSAYADRIQQSMEHIYFASTDTAGQLQRCCGNVHPDAALLREGNQFHLGLDGRDDCGKLG